MIVGTQHRGTAHHDSVGEPFSPVPTNVAGVQDPGSPSPTIASQRPRIAWLLGWAIPEPWFAAIAKAEIPDAQHHFFVPLPSALDTLEAAGPFDCIYGYSLGSLLLLQNAHRVSRLGRVELLAPIFAFPCEEALGGRISRTQVRQLARWVRRDPTAALADFYLRAGLGIKCRAGSPHPAVGEDLIKCVPDILPPLHDQPSPLREAASSALGPPRSDIWPPVSDLLWGLDQLATARFAPPLPPTWRAWCGANDALLDAAQLQALDPRIEIVPNATHHPAALIRACASDVSNDLKR